MSTERKYPCIDKYTEGEPSLLDIKKTVENELQKNVLAGKLSSSRTKVDSSAIFEKVKAAFLTSAMWVGKKTSLRIHFMDGTPKQKDWVKYIVKKELEPLCTKLTFIWDVERDDSNIRISFQKPGEAWSYIGTNCEKIDKSEPTMNLGWLDDDIQYDAPMFRGKGTVVIHEFCHALGMVHEHQNPNGGGIVWNKPVVYRELKRTNGWDKETVDSNIFQKYGDREMCQLTRKKEKYPGKDFDIKGYCYGEAVNGSEYDMKSIMHYFYPSSWILEGNKDIPTNTELSELDTLWLKKHYSVKGTTPILELDHKGVTGASEAPISEVPSADEHKGTQVSKANAISRATTTQADDTTVKMNDTIYVYPTPTQPARAMRNVEKGIIFQSMNNDIVFLTCVSIVLCICLYMILSKSYTQTTTL